MRLETSHLNAAGALALGVAALSSSAAHAAEPKLLVFLHVAIKQRAFQSELQAALPGIVVTAVGRVADFVRALSSNQDAVLTLPVVLAAQGLTSKLRGVSQGSTEEKYSIVSAGAARDPAQVSAIGALDLLGRDGTNAFVHGLLNVKPKVERVTKVEDLLALLQMERVDAILVPSRLFAEIAQGSRLPLAERTLATRVGLPAVETLGPLGAQVLPALSKLPAVIKKGLGVEEWR
jgi:hypothetical protein